MRQGRVSGQQGCGCKATTGVLRLRFCAPRYALAARTGRLRCACPTAPLFSSNWNPAMPIYAYKCGSCGHAKDALQKMSDPVLSTCPACGAEAFSKQLTAAGFQLKGSGWYVTDFRGGNTAAPAAASEADPVAPAAPNAAATANGPSPASAAPTSAAAPATTTTSPSPSPTRGAAGA